MRSILAIISLFWCCMLSAQEYTPTYGRELPRGMLIPYPTAQEATAAEGGDTKYFTRITEWQHHENIFSTTFTTPFAWANRQALFHLDWASADYEIRVNGQTTAYNGNGNVPAEFNLTRYVQEGRNTLEIVLSTPSPVAMLESWKNTPAPAIGQAWVFSQPTLRVRDVLTKAWRTGIESNTVMGEVALIVKTESLNPRTSRIHYDLLSPKGDTAATGHKDVTLGMRGEDTVRFLARIPDSLLWSAESPIQYTVRVRTQHEGRYAEYIEMKLGFRTIDVNGGQLVVNGTPVMLRVREVTPQIDLNDIAKLREQGFNTLKLLPGYVPAALYEYCDKHGMYVIAQAPIDTRSSGESRRIGGNPSNHPKWLDAYIERTEDSYHASKRHPSVIAFSLATRSANGINLYESYLNIKKSGDFRPFIYPDAAGEWNTDKLNLE